MNKSKLRGKIAENGLNVRKLAPLIGMSEQSLYRRMQGRSRWYLDEIQNVCEVLGITSDKEIVEFFFR